MECQCAHASDPGALCRAAAAMSSARRARRSATSSSIACRLGACARERITAADGIMPVSPHAVSILTPGRARSSTHPNTLDCESKRQSRRCAGAIRRRRRRMRIERAGGASSSWRPQSAQERPARRRVRFPARFSRATAMSRQPSEPNSCVHQMPAARGPAHATLQRRQMRAAAHTRNAQFISHHLRARLLNALRIA